jgi:addiction module RelE/StbE family toxin
MTVQRLEWKQAALDDRAEIMDFIAMDNPGAAIELDVEIEDQAEKVSLGRGASRLGRVPGTREIVAHRNYVIVYQDVGDVMQVLRVLHAAMQWPPRRGMGAR